MVVESTSALLAPGEVADAARASFAKAVDGGVVEWIVILAGRAVRLRFAGTTAEVIGPALASRRIPNDSAPSAAAVISVWDSQGTGAPRVVGAKSDGAPEGEASGWQSGVSWAGGDDRVRARWWPDRQLFMGYDAAQREGWWWTTDATATAWYERAAPLRALVHFWAQAERLHLVHAAAVGTGDGRGVLLAGPSGSGKSTTALACLAAPLVFVGDDYALFEPGTPPLVHALYGTAKVDPTSMQWLPELQGARRRASGTEGEKLVLDVGRAMPKKLASCLTVEAVLVARRTATGPRVVSVDRPSALRALAPSTLLQLDRHGAARSLQAMARLLEQVPTYALELGPDPRAVPPCLADLLRAGGPS